MEPPMPPSAKAGVANIVEPLIAPMPTSAELISWARIRVERLRSDAVSAAGSTDACEGWVMGFCKMRPPVSRIDLPGRGGETFRLGG